MYLYIWSQITREKLQTGSTLPLNTSVPPKIKNIQLHSHNILLKWDIKLHVILLSNTQTLLRVYQLSQIIF